MRMFVINLAQAVRNLIRYKWQTLISVVGLTFGLVCLAFSVNWFWYETHYESFRTDYDQLYQLKRKAKDPVSGEVGSFFPCLLTDVLRSGLTTVEGVTMFDGPVRFGEHNFNGTVMELSGYMNVQPDYFDVLGQPLLYGDRRTALTQPGQVVVSRSLAERVFNTPNAVGQRLEIDGNSYTVAGVTSDVPAHSHLRAELYFPYEMSYPRETWQWCNGQVQLVLRTDDPAATARELAALTDNCIDSYTTLSAARALARRHRLLVVLKGHYTAICTPSGHAYLNPTGNAGMATAGSGDVLTGLLTALLARGYQPEAACRLGVYLHGLAGDLAAARLGEESLTASDLVDELPAAFRTLYADLKP